MKYPFSPEILDAMPSKCAKLFEELEETLIIEICKRLKAGQMNQATIEMIKALRAQGISLEKIKAAIASTARLSDTEVNALLDDAVARNNDYYSELMSQAGLTEPDVLISEKDIEAIRRQTEETFENLTRSMGYVIDGKITPVTQAYRRILDNAEMLVTAGNISYSQAIYSAISKLADSGLRVVDYSSGATANIDVAARRAIMTGVNQLCDKYTEQAAQRLETDLFEVSAHIGARDKGTGPMNHKEWQGKVYSTREDDPKYPNIYKVTGLGTGEGLEGWNCRHRRFPFVDGISERTYTDEELQNIDPPPFTYNGKQYTCYEATQEQRRIERTIRKSKRRYLAFKAAGLEDNATAEAVKMRRLEELYKDFSQKAGLPLQTERANAYDMHVKEYLEATEDAEKHHSSWLKSINAENTPLKTVADYMSAKLHNSKDFIQLRDYNWCINKKEIVPAVGLDRFVNVWNEAEKRFVGLTLPGNVIINRIVGHSVARIIGNTDPVIPIRHPVSFSDIEDFIKTVSDYVDEEVNNEVRRVYKSQTLKISISLVDGAMVTIMPTKRYRYNARS